MLAALAFRMRLGCRINVQDTAGERIGASREAAIWRRLSADFRRIDTTETNGTNQEHYYAIHG
jgi:hypothetical protein